MAEAALVELAATRSSSGAAALDDCATLSTAGPVLGTTLKVNAQGVYFNQDTVALQSWCLSRFPNRNDPVYWYGSATFAEQVTLEKGLRMQDITLSPDDLRNIKSVLAQAGSLQLPDGPLTFADLATTRGSAAYGGCAWRGKNEIISGQWSFQSELSAKRTRLADNKPYFVEIDNGYRCAYIDFHSAARAADAPAADFDSRLISWDGFPDGRSGGAHFQIIAQNFAFYDADISQWLQFRQDAGGISMNWYGGGRANRLDAVLCVDYQFANDKPLNSTVKFNSGSFNLTGDPDTGLILLAAKSISLAGDVFVNSVRSRTDLRLTQNISSVNAAESLRQLALVDPVTFEFRSQPGKRCSGVVAQELQMVWPEAVTQDANGFLSVDYSFVLMRLLAAVQQVARQSRLLEPSVS